MIEAAWTAVCSDDEGHESCMVAVGCRWQGRLEEAPFAWGPKGEILPQHDAWLRQMDMSKCGLASLQGAHASAAAFQADLNAAKVEADLLTACLACQNVFLGLMFVAGPSCSRPKAKSRHTVATSSGFPIAPVASAYSGCSYSRFNK